MYPPQHLTKLLLSSSPQVLNENKGSSETALFKNRSTNSLANSQPATSSNHHSNHPNNSAPSSAPTATSALSTIRTKNVIPSKDKSQLQHLSAASSNQHHSPNYSQPAKSRDEHSIKSTKEKHHPAKNSDFATLFGTPIQAKSAKEGKSKKHKSSSEKSGGNSRCSTPTSTISNHQLAANRDGYPDMKKERSHSKDSHQTNKSNGQSRGPTKADKPNKIKKQLDLPANTSKSHKSPSVASKYDERRRHHSKNAKGSRSPSYSPERPVEHGSRLTDHSKSSKFKKRKRSVSSGSNDSDRSEHSSRASSRSYSSGSSASSRSDSNSSSTSSWSSSEHRSRSKKRNRDQYSPVKKKSKNKTSHSKAKVKKEQPSNLSSSRNLSSSLSSLNSEYKATKEEPKKKKKSKDRPRDEDDDEMPGKKAHKEKRKHKDDDGKKEKNSKATESGGKEEERSSNKKIIKEKNKDSISKQTSHKEHNLKKEATTSTKISFSNNNSTGLTTLEITSVKNVKMLQSESKKSKQHQDQSLNQSDKRSFKDKLPADSYVPSPLTKDDQYENGTPYSSPGYPDYHRTSGKQTGDGRRKSEKAAYAERIMSDMRKNSEEISPLNSESENFDDPYQSNDESSALRSNFHNGSVKEETKSRKAKRPAYSDEEADDQLRHEYVSDLLVLQKQISELKDKEMLHEIVQIVRESGTFTMNGTKFDFDLLKLDKTTVKKVKMCFS